MTVAVERLLTEHLDTWTAAVETKSPAGRGSSKKLNLVGIKKLRELILELAVRGQLVPQDENDEPAEVLLARIAAERERLVKEKKVRNQKDLPPIDETEINSPLPTGWKWARIGFLFNSIISGGTPSKRNPRFWGGDIPWASVKDLGVSRNLSETQDYITEEGLAAGSKLADIGDVLICTRMGLGKITIAGVPVAFNQDLKSVKLSSYLDVNYFLNAYATVKIKGTGTTVAGIKQEQLLEYVIGLPPLREQKRIVAKVDELMALCDALEQEQESSIAAHALLVENLLAALTNAANQGEFKQAWARVAAHFDTLFTTEQSVEQLKQTVLQLAVMGKLVEQDPADEPAGVLLERIAAEKARLVKEKKIKKQKVLPEISEEEKVFELPEGWAWVRIADLMQPDRDISYGIIKLGTEQEKGGIPTLRCSDVRPRRLDLQGVKKVSPLIESEYQRTRLVGGEVLVNIRGTLGGVAVVPKELAGYNIAREVAMLPINGELDGKFLVDLIASPFFWSMIEENLKGIAYKGLNLSTLRSMAIAIPPATEQKRISEKVEELMFMCEQLNLLINRSQTVQLSLATALTERVV